MKVLSTRGTATQPELGLAEVTRSRRSVTFLTMRLMDGEIDLVARFVVATSRASEGGGGE